jgi:hypothetical protein
MVRGVDFYVFMFFMTLLCIFYTNDVYCLYAICICCLIIIRFKYLYSDDICHITECQWLFILMIACFLKFCGLVIMNY